MVRFWANGWIETLYILPKYHFKYSGFEFITVPGQWTCAVFALAGISALLLAAGYKYRMSCLVFFLSFTFIELLDKTNYLNHYYFVSIISFMLIWLPAHCTHSVDASRSPSIRAQYIKAWQIDCLKLMVAIVYIYAGLAKLNADWLFRAMPLAIWLPSHADLPLIGQWMHKSWMHYLFSWSGAIYDLSIVFFLLCRKTRVMAFMVVVIFHILTRVLFPIGMFPYIMVSGALVFFSTQFHTNALNKIFNVLKLKTEHYTNGEVYTNRFWNTWGLKVIAGFLIFQLLFPFRQLLYKGNLFWNERGYRFSWRVMLMEKTGNAHFKIVDGQSGDRFYVQNGDFLTARQQKQMSTQPDFILQYGQYLGQHFSNQGHQNVEVYVDSHVALNGRRSQPYIHADANLMELSYSELCNDYIHPFRE